MKSTVFFTEMQTQAAAAGEKGNFALAISHEIWYDISRQCKKQNSGESQKVSAEGVTQIFRRKRESAYLSGKRTGLKMQMFYSLEG